MAAQSSNKTRSSLEDAIVEYSQAVADDEESFSFRTKDRRAEAWEQMMEALDEHEEALYKEAYNDGRNEAVNHQLAQKEMSGNV